MRSAFLLFAAVFALNTIGCGSSSPSAAKTEEASKPKEETPPPAKDNTGLLPAGGRLSAQVVPNHLLDIPALPGGTLGVLLVP